MDYVDLQFQQMRVDFSITTPEGKIPHFTVAAPLMPNLGTGDITQEQYIYAFKGACNHMLGVLLSNYPPFKDKLDKPSKGWFS